MFKVFGDDVGAVLERVARRLDQAFVGCGLHDPRFVVELEDRHLAALAIDDAQIAHDAGQQLRLAAVDQIVDAAAHELAHLALDRVKQVA